MTSRFQRGKTGAISPFFAFQDIITSAMAVLIAIIMLLAIYMGAASREAGAPGTPETPALAARLKGALDQLASAQEEIRSARESTAEDRADPALIEGQIQALRLELQMVRGDAKSRSDETRVIQENDGARGLRLELESKQAKNAKFALEIEKLDKEASRSREEMERLEIAVRNQEAALIEEQTRRNQLWVIPDRAASSKEPVLVIVSENRATLQCFDHPEKQTLDGSEVRNGFTAALKPYSALNQYIVFYFKPSGAVHFKRLTEQAKEAGFEIGYDAINEDVAINFKNRK